MIETSDSQPIRARGLSKTYADIKAVSKVDIDLMPGRALGLLGPNGAGKSTTLAMLMGMERPDSGSVLIFGHPAGSPDARRLVGVTPQSTGFPEQLSPREIIQYTAARFGTQPDIDDLVSLFGLGALIDRRVVGFSGGEIRRVALALAFVGKPNLLFLDEPTTGLDIEAQRGFSELLRNYVRQGGSLILTSHNWEELETVCDDIALIDAGETVLTGKLEDIRARTAANRISFVLSADTAPPNWLHASFDMGRWVIESGKSDAVLRRMTVESVPFEQLTVEPLKLKALIERVRNEGGPK